MGFQFQIDESLAASGHDCIDIALIVKLHGDSFLWIDPWRDERQLFSATHGRGTFHNAHYMPYVSAKPLR